MFYFFTPWKREKTWGFLMFSGDIEIEHSANELKNHDRDFQQNTNYAIFAKKLHHWYLSVY